MEKIIKEYTPVKMAYIGDSVYELFIREYILNKYSYPMKRINSEVVKYVNAKSQAYIVEKLELNEIEKLIVSKGKNIKSNPSSSSTTVYEYRLASGFEALVGALYLSKNDERLKEILCESLEVLDAKI